jgi:hypothetical protein
VGPLGFRVFVETDYFEGVVVAVVVVAVVVMVVPVDSVPVAVVAVVVAVVLVSSTTAGASVVVVSAGAASSFFLQPVTSAVPSTATRPRVRNFFINLISFFRLPLFQRKKIPQGKIEPE